jgi:hypothetical protein
MSGTDPKTVVVPVYRSCSQRNDRRDPGQLRAGVQLVLGTVVAEGNLVAAEWTTTGTSKDGVPYRNRNIGLFTATPEAAAVGSHAA